MGKKDNENSTLQKFIKVQCEVQESTNSEKMEL
jgi:hypothetical protein